MTHLLALCFALFALALAPAGAQDDVPPLDWGRAEVTTLAGVTYEFRVEIAATPAQQARGLMFREHLPPGEGMIFTFPQERPRAFWMRDTLIPLDMLFIRADGTVANVVHEAEPLSETPRRSAGPVATVLEIAGGLARTLGIGPGARVRLITE